MARAPHESGIAIHANAIWRAVDIAKRDAFENVAQRSSGFIDRQIVKRNWICRSCGTEAREFFADKGKPERGIGCIAIRSVFAENSIGQRAILFETSKGDD